MPSDRTRQDEMTADRGPGYPKGRRGAAGSDLGQQGLGQDFGQGFGAADDEPPRRSRLLPLVIAFFALAAFAGIVWYAYEWGVGDVEPEHLPVVQAPSGAIKEKPAEPGGLEVPYTDSAVLNRGSGAEQASRIESLLPPPEEPVEVPAPPAAEPEPAPQAATPEAAAPGTAAPDTAASETGVSETAEPAAPAGVDAPATGAAAPEAGEPQPAAAPEARMPEAQAPASDVPSLPELPRAESAADAPAAEQPAAGTPKPLVEAPAEETVTAREAPEQPAAGTPEAEPAPQAAQAPAEVAPGSWMIQLAALRQEPAARQEWQRIQGRHRELLGSMSLQLERADLGERGVYYRVQTGPLPNRATAVDLCAQLKSAGQDCIATRR